MKVQQLTTANSNKEFLKLTTTNLIQQQYQFSDKVSDLEQEFHDSIREVLVFIFIYMFLYACAYFALKTVRKSKSEENDDYYDFLMDNDDRIADRIRIWLCTFTLATCFGAVLLLPMSIVASEVMRMAPNSYYLKWLNSSLLDGLWNSIFLFSNISLFLFLPFAHLFFDSVGLPGHKKGIRSRIVETLLLLVFVAISILGISSVISTMLYSSSPSSSSYFSSSSSKTKSIFYLRDQLPFIYSCISFTGVLILLVCTPLGFSRLFTIVTNLILRSTFRDDANDELEAIELQKSTTIRKIQDLEHRHGDGTTENRNFETVILLSQYKKELEQIDKQIKQLVNESKRSNLYRNVCYILILVFLLLLNVFSIFIVAKNTFLVIFGKIPTIKASSSAEYNSSRENSAQNSMFTFGTLEILLEIVLILYFMIASLVGFYTIPMFNRILPRYKSTATDKIILNCAIFLIFSLALPVSSKILGLTKFDLLGQFGELNWLSNMHIILVYNFVFTIATGMFFFTKLTNTIRIELYNRVTFLTSTLLKTADSNAHLGAENKRINSNKKLF